MSGAELAAVMDAELRRVGDDHRAKHEERYLRSELQHLGASVPAIRKVAKAALASHGPLAHDELVDLVTALWSARCTSAGRRSSSCSSSVSRRSSRVTWSSSSD